MDNLYTIGQTAEMFGLTVQALRYYSKIGLLAPHFINPQNGYRYYSYEQFNIIDRIKYLQHLGLSLNEIHEIYLANQPINNLKTCLDKQNIALERQITTLQNLKATVQAYKNYFSTGTNMTKTRIKTIPYMKTLPNRHLLCVSCAGKTREERHIALFRLSHDRQYQHLNILRQFVLLLDWQALQQHQIKPQYMGFYVIGPVPSHDDAIKEIASNNFVCFQGEILSGNWDGALAVQLAQNLSSSPLVIANEYENSLTSYKKCPYEVEISLPLI